ncbi:hypothetical protein TWF718_006086 [Orbilia javanica]|uniref:Methyltransferase domain-containing protein n=1 Tax=Orbilia javanica TaxID=47235 RepID=A0AAN8RE29_9PEZI
MLIWVRVIGIRTGELKDQSHGSGTDGALQGQIDDEHYRVTVIQMGDGCVALNPYVCKPRAANEKPLALQSTAHPEPSFHLLEASNDLKLFKELQNTAMKALYESDSWCNNTGCDVDIQTNSDGGLSVFEVSPLPSPFFPTRELQDLAIRQDFPGSYPALIDTFITNLTLHDSLQEATPKVGNLYTQIVDKYMAAASAPNNQMYPSTFKSIDGFDFSGTSFDLACGTGIFGRALADSKAARGDTGASRVIGFDISAGMADACRQTGHYENVHLEPMQRCLTNHRIYHDGDIDHVLCFSGFHFLSPEDFSFVLALCFTLAKKSITFSLDEITDIYNEAIAARGLSFAHSINHIATMEAFGVPRGWRLAHRFRQFSWTSPTTEKHEIYTNYFRFERVEPDETAIMFGKLGASDKND